MNLDKDLLVLFVLVALLDIQLSLQADSFDQFTGTRKYCGRNLVNVLTMVCDGIYNHQMPIKSTNEESNGQKLKIPQLREKRSVVTIFQRSDHHRRHRRGAYDECCRKGCSMDEMVGYCGSA